MGVESDDYVIVIALIMLAIGAGIGYILNENQRLQEMTYEAERSDKITKVEKQKAHSKRESKSRGKSKSKRKSKRDGSKSKSRSRSRKSKSKSRKSKSNSKGKKKHSRKVESSIGSCGSSGSDFASSFQEKAPTETFQPQIQREELGNQQINKVESS